MWHLYQHYKHNMQKYGRVASFWYLHVNYSKIGFPGMLSKKLFFKEKWKRQSFNNYPNQTTVIRKKN